MKTIGWILCTLTVVSATAVCLQMQHYYSETLCGQASLGDRQLVMTSKILFLVSRNTQRLTAMENHLNTQTNQIMGSK